jgi:ankyrin repeat protein
MGWSHKDIPCIMASCSIKDLGLEGEEVVISADPPGNDRSRRLLLQSLQRPELGITVLMLDAAGNVLSGGDEDWKPGMPPLIQAKRVSTSPIASRSQQWQQGIAVQPGRQTTALASAESRPHWASRPGEGSGAGTDPVIGVSAEPFPKLFHDPDSPEYAAESAEIASTAAQQGGPVDGGIGRSGMDLRGKASAYAKKGGPSQDEELAAMRPDLAADAPAQRRDASAAARLEAAERLVCAAASGETGDMRKLIAQIGSNVAAPLGSKYPGITPLMVAAERGRIDALDLLLEKEVDLESSHENGWTAIMFALHGQRPLAVTRLLAARANPDGGKYTPGSERTTPLMLSAAGARPEMCGALLKAKARLETRDSNGMRAVHHAARNGRGGSLVQLLAARALVDEVDRDGHTPLLLAASSGRAECAKSLLSAKANLHAEDPNGRTSKQLAMVYGHDRTLEVLEEAASHSTLGRWGPRGA